ncbi:MAG: hypothetical protein IKY93_06575 [Alistipes sp.]|nr:hypothetical protein [Alistipes sp.]
MVEIVSRPEDFTPVRDGVVFVVESQKRSDFVVKIYEVESGEEVGRKRLYSTKRAVVDIAPYVADMAGLFIPTKGLSELRAVDAQQYMIEVEESDVVVARSEAVWVSSNIAKDVVGINSIFSTSGCRKMCYGDEDDIRINSGEQGLITVDVLADTGESYNYNIQTYSGLALFHLSTAMFGKAVKNLAVGIYFNGDFLQGIEYQIIQSPTDAVRLMWYTSVGTLEHYTFPIVHSRVVEAAARRRYVSASGYQSSCTSVERLKIGTKRCSQGELQALSTLITAPKVWIEGAEDYEEVVVADNEAVVYQLGKVGQMSVVIEHNREEVWL